MLIVYWKIIDDYETDKYAVYCNVCAVRLGLVDGDDDVKYSRLHGYFAIIQSLTYVLDVGQ